LLRNPPFCVARASFTHALAANIDFRLLLPSDKARRNPIGGLVTLATTNRAKIKNRFKIFGMAEGRLAELDDYPNWEN
jgi:hypothetical protein